MMLTPALLDQVGYGIAAAAVPEQIGLWPSRNSDEDSTG